MGKLEGLRGWGRVRGILMMKRHAYGKGFGVQHNVLA